MIFSGIISAIITVGVGFGVGLLSGLLGIGGGTILVSVFTLGMGMPAVTATGTSLFTIIPTSISGAIAHLRERSADWRVGLSMGIGGACASPVGVQLAQISPEWLVLCFVALVLMYSAITMLVKALKKPKASLNSVASEAEVSKASQAEVANDAKSVTFSGAVFFKSLIIGVLAGLAGGYVGLGGGFIMVPMMSSLLAFPMRLASGTSLIGILCIAIPGAITQATYGSVDFLTGILVAVGSIPGALVGTRLGKNVNDRALRLMFAGLLAVVSILMVVSNVL